MARAAARSRSAALSRTLGRASVRWCAVRGKAEGYHPWPAAIRQGQEDDDPVLQLRGHMQNTAEGQAADERDDRARVARAARLTEARGLLLAQDVLAMS